jgi:protein SCO1/2
MSKLSPKQKTRLLSVALGVTIGLLLASTLAAWQITQDQSRRETLAAQAKTETLPEAAKPAPAIGGHFDLLDQDGKPATDAQFAGKYQLVYFGYTYCPDMCPTGLQSMSRAMDLLGDKAAKVQPMFISVDPERDTPKVVKEYIGNFHPSIIGLTGSAAQIAAAAKAYKVYYKKAEQVDDENYMMDHSTLIFLMGPDGKFIDTFQEDVDPKILVQGIEKAMRDKS